VPSLPLPAVGPVIHSEGRQGQAGCTYAMARQSVSSTRGARPRATRESVVVCVAVDSKGGHMKSGQAGIQVGSMSLIDGLSWPVSYIKGWRTGNIVSPPSSCILGEIYERQLG
jgi:hypothetical protein